MAHESTTAPSCLSSFWRRSQHNGLPHGTSSEVSALYVRSWGALALGVICGCVTALVLFEDVVRNGAPISTDHVLTAAVIVITAASGHMWWRRLWSSAFIVGVGLLFIFASGLIYLVVASGGRNAEVMIAKRNAAHHANTERERIRPLREADEKRRQQTQAKLQSDCVDGKKGKGHCDGLRATLGVYTAAVKGHDADLEKLGPEQEEDGALKSTARVIVAWQGVPETERAQAEAGYVERLQLLLPYVKALLVEIATVVFMGVAFGHRTTVVSAPAATVAPPKPQVSRPTTVATPATVTRLTTVAPNNPEALTLQLLQRSATVPQAAVVQLFGGDKARASRFLKRLELEGVITRAEAGREKSVTLMKERSRA